MVTPAPDPRRKEQLEDGGSMTPELPASASAEFDLAEMEAFHADLEAVMDQLPRHND